MRVLLAGATGALGRLLVPALTRAGHEVVALIRDPGNRPLAENLGARPVIADVMDRAGLLRAVTGLRAEAVMHQATALRGASPRLKPDDPTNALRTTGTAHLLEAAAEVGATRFVTQSLITGYGYLDHGEKVLTEADAFGLPRGNYGDPVVEGSRSTEAQVFAAAGIEGIALRYGMFYGPRGFSDMFADLMRKRVPVLPMGNGGPTSWLHLADAAHATVAALESGRAGQAYNLVDDSPASWAEFAGTVARTHGTPAPKRLPRWLLRLAAPYLVTLMADTTLRVSAARAHAELGWRPRYPSLAEGLRADASHR